MRRGSGAESFRQALKHIHNIILHPEAEPDELLKVCYLIPLVTSIIVFSMLSLGIETGRQR